MISYTAKIHVRGAKGSIEWQSFKFLNILSDHDRNNFIYMSGGQTQIYVGDLPHNANKEILMRFLGRLAQFRTYL